MKDFIALLDILSKKSDLSRKFIGKGEGEGTRRKERGARMGGWEDKRM